MTTAPSNPERLRREDARWLSQPLPIDGVDPSAAEAQTRHMARLLRSGDSPCAAMVAHAMALYDLSLPDERPGLACGKGCAHCCHQPVVITAPEAFSVASAIRSDPARVRMVLDADQRFRSLGRGRSAPCPMLTDAICGIYGARPLACRGFVSLSLEACLATFSDTGPKGIPAPQAEVVLPMMVRMLMVAALRAVRLDDSLYELTGAVARILRDGEAEKRWLAGEPVLDGLELSQPVPEQFEATVRRIVADVRPTL